MARRSGANSVEEKENHSMPIGPDAAQQKQAMYLAQDTGHFSLIKYERYICYSSTKY
jgi:hypothetical protein